MLHPSKIIRPETKINGNFTWFSWSLLEIPCCFELIHVIFFSGRAQYWLGLESIWYGEKCFWSGADVSLSMYINIKILFLEQNFNVYISTGNLFSEKQCWPAEGGFPKPIALCIPRLCPWFHSKYCTRWYQRRNKGGTKINTFFYFLHILSISGYATFIIIHKSSCGCVLW